MLPFIGNQRQNQAKGIPFRLMDYLKLVDWTGRAIRENKRGAIPQDLAPILQRLNLDPENWTDQVNSFGRRKRTAVGPSTPPAGLGFGVASSLVYDLNRLVALVELLDVLDFFAFTGFPPTRE